MKMMTGIRSAALVALLAAALPAPAHAQFGFIKKQIKEKIVHTLIDSAVSKVAGGPLDSARTGAGPAAAATQARPSAAPKGPHFDDMVIEITPRSLDVLEKYLKMHKEQAASGRPAPQALAFTPDQKTVQFSLMTQRVVAFCSAAAPEGAAGAAMSAMAVANDLQGQYTPTEIATLRPRCHRLMSLLGNAQPAGENP